MNIFWHKILLIFNFSLIFLLFIILLITIKKLFKNFNDLYIEIYELRVMFHALNNKFNNLIKSKSDLTISNDWFLRKKENKDVSFDS